MGDNKSTPDWQVLCLRLWSSSKGGYTTPHTEVMQGIVNEIDEWIVEGMEESQKKVGFE